jgi:hypothetical protein
MYRSAFAALTLTVVFTAPSFCQGTKLTVRQAIEAKFPLTKATADRTDIVTAGAVIDLMKDDLYMFSPAASMLATPAYKDGKFAYGMIDKTKILAAKKAGTVRQFVAGEKFWLIGLDIQDDAAVLEFLSDPISDTRYKTKVKYPYPSGAMPAPEVFLAKIEESIKAEPSEDKQPAAAPARPGPAPASAPPPPPAPDLPPPPPPTDAPPPVKDQTKDQVVKAFGQPTSINRAGAKEIDIYPGMKVTYVNGKVTDVQLNPN